MDDNDTQSFSEDEPIQESTYLAHAEIEDISPTFVTVTEFLNLTLNDEEHLNEPVAIENISVNKTIWSKSYLFKHILCYKFKM